jgi:hypothetical protein
MTAGIPPVVLARLCLAVRLTERERIAALAKDLEAVYPDDDCPWTWRDFSWRVRHPAQSGDT